jgi:hypothetical protein|tara:strand:- start:1062 stop:1451 length:390 start_codon:yes stop_codon:yes gene_type:complete
MLFFKTIIVSGMDDSKISKSEGIAALAKNASEVNDQIAVVRVWKSKGASRRTAGNSFIVIKKTVAAAMVSPDLKRGTLVTIADLIRFLPRVIDDSSYLGLIWVIDDLIALSPVGIHSTAQAITNRYIDW